MIINGKSKHGGDIYTNEIKIDFSTNVTPLGTPKEIKDEIIKNVDKLAIYPDPYCKDLINKLAKKENLKPTYFILGNGASELIYNFAYTLRKKKALIISPTFSEYEDSLKVYDIEYDYYFLKEELDFNLDTDFLDFLKIHHYDCLYICNPNNPTGKLIKKELLIKICDYCLKENIQIFLDECFYDLVDDDVKYSMKDYVELYPNLFILRAFTKSYGMAGLRLGYGICSNQELLIKLSNLVQLWNISTLAVVAGKVALDLDESIKKIKEIIKIEKAYLKQELLNLNFIVFDSTANFLFFKAERDLDKKLKEKGILIRSCANYPSLNNQYYRIGIRLHQDNEILIKTIKEIYHG